MPLPPNTHRERRQPKSFTSLQTWCRGSCRTEPSSSIGSPCPCRSLRSRRRTRPRRCCSRLPPARIGADASAFCLSVRCTDRHGTRGDERGHGGGNGGAGFPGCVFHGSSQLPIRVNRHSLGGKINLRQLYRGTRLQTNNKGVTPALRTSAPLALLIFALHVGARARAPLPIARQALVESLAATGRLADVDLEIVASGASAANTHAPGAGIRRAS